MDFLDPKKRKSHQTRLFIGYGLMALLIGIVSVLLLLQAYGYTYNIRTGNVSQNGLLFVDSHPLPATLSLNGQDKGITDQRLVLREGVYDIALEREGYHSWEKNLILRGGVIERFLYPFMFPMDIESGDIELFSEQPQFVTQSPDRQWLIVQVPGTLSAFEVINLNQETPSPFRVNLPEGLLTTSGATHNLELVEWSTNNRHFVLRHDFEGGNEYVLVDTQTIAASQNLNELLPTPFTSLRLKDKKFDEYYLFAAKNKALSSFELGDEQAALVVNNVLAYHSHGDDEMLYVTDGGEKDSKTVALRMTESGKTYTIRELPRGDRYLLELAQYEGKWIVAAGTVDDNRVYVYKDPLQVLRQQTLRSPVPVAVLQVDDPRAVSFSQNVRILAVQSGPKLAIYDAETGRTVHYGTDFNVKKSDRFVWMDGHRLTTVVGGVQQVFDFDGTNYRELGSGYDDASPYFDRDYTAAFTIAPSLSVDGRAALQRTELIVEEN